MKPLLALIIRFTATTFLIGASQLAAAQAAGAPTTTILAIGNSLTLHKPMPTIGWSGDWGMAASKESRDYVAQFSEQLAALNGRRAEAKRINFAIFERSFWTDSVAALQNSIISEVANANIVIVQLSDNVSESDLVTYDYEKHYSNLLKEIALSAPSATIRCLGPWWPNALKEQIIDRACSKVSGQYIKISDLQAQTINRAGFGNKLANAGVAAHPSDLGMHKIASRILATTQRMKPRINP